MIIHVEIYLAAKQLEREGKETFSQAELEKKVASMFDDRRSGISTDIVSRTNATAPKSHGVVYNYLTRIDSGMYRRYRVDDAIHPSRLDAASKPSLDDVPSEFWPLWADEVNEAPIIFDGFKAENMTLFETEQKTYRQGDPIGKIYQDKWIEWKQFVQLVVNETGNKFISTTENWQNSGALSKRFWSTLRDKGNDSYSTCMSLKLGRDHVMVNLGFINHLAQKGKALDSRAQFNSWMDEISDETIPEVLWNNLSVWLPKINPVTLKEFMTNQQSRSVFLQKLAAEPELNFEIGCIFPKEEVLKSGAEIVAEAAAVIQQLYPLYRRVMQKSNDTMYLIGSSPEMKDCFAETQEFIKANGALMIWWSYIIREEYQSHLKKNLPFKLFIYGTAPNGKRAITHVMTVSEFVTAPGNDGLISPYPEITLEQDRSIKRAGNTQSEIFKTWVKITKLEELDKPIGIDEFVQYDTQGFVNPSLMVNSFVYARRIQADELTKRLANCINVTLERLGLRVSDQRPLDEAIREKKGFSFDLALAGSGEASLPIIRISGSRYKQKNQILLHVMLNNDMNNLREKLGEQDYTIWLKDGKDPDSSVKFEDDHSITADGEASHLKLADIDLDNFSADSFIEPLQKLQKSLAAIGSLPDNENEEVAVRQAWATKGINEILNAFDESEYVFDENMVINLHTCLNALAEKHFIILTGISGTGKTKFTQIYVNAFYGLPAGDRNNPFFALIPVQPQWSDRTGRLGYFNPLTGKYHRQQFLDHLLKAQNDPQHNYFVCLDEMNLAVVEHYFADVLSAMESNHKIQLHTFETSVDGVPPFIEIPANFFVVGTVNVDETTHQFSPKVLDRAYTIELNQVDLERYRNKYLERSEAAGHQEVIHYAADLCNKINKVLERQNMHFAYRTAKEIFAYMLFNSVSSVPLLRENAMDNMVMQKVLPKLRGDERIDSMLSELSSIVKTGLNIDNSGLNPTLCVGDPNRKYRCT